MTVSVTASGFLLLDELFGYLDHAINQRLEKFIRENQGTQVFGAHDRLQGLTLVDDAISLAGGEQVKSPLINLHHGCCINHVFNSRKLDIILSSPTLKRCRCFN